MVAAAATAAAGWDYRGRYVRPFDSCIILFSGLVRSDDLDSAGEAADEHTHDWCQHLPTISCYLCYFVTSSMCGCFLGGGGVDMVIIMLH